MDSRGARPSRPSARRRRYHDLPPRRRNRRHGGEQSASTADSKTRDEPAVADVVEFAYLTCLRRGNALGAVWPWFNLHVEHGAVVGGSVCLPSAVTKNKRPLALALTGQLLALVARRWPLRVSESPFVFHRSGRRLVRFDTAWDAASAAVDLPGLLFHDLRRSGARNYRRAGVAEDVIQRIGGWKTASMFERYNIVDERDLAEAGERLAVFLTGAASASPTVVQLAAAPPLAPAGNTDRTRTILASPGLHRLLRWP